MRQTKIIMGMPVTVQVIDQTADKQTIRLVFDYFKQVDRIFSTYKKDSEISKINRGELRIQQTNPTVQLILKLCEQTKKETYGYFDAYNNGNLDPSGLVKGWAIWEAAKLLKKKGFKNFYIDAGGDVQTFGCNINNKLWTVGIRNPFNAKAIIKVLKIKNKGVATSGAYERGDHVYDPIGKQKIKDIVSLTVIGPNIYEADKFATAGFAMGKNGIEFIESKKNLAGYMIGKEGTATFTSNFEKYVKHY